MRPTLRQLEYIVEVADTGRFGLAAARLHVSQPSLSAQIAQTEADLGLRIFNRGRHGATLTPAGADLVRRARLILREVEDLRASVHEGGVFSGRLRLGVLPSVGPYLLPSVVQRLHADHPGLRLVIREESTKALEEGLRSGRLDLVVSTPEDHPGTQHVPLFAEALWAAVANDDGLAKTAGPVALSALSGRVLLTLGAAHRLSNVVAALAARAGAFVSDEYEGTSLDAIRLMAAGGSGVAILPEIYVKTEARRGTDVALRRINDPMARRSLSLILPATGSATDGAAVIATALRDSASKLLGAPD